MSLTSCILRVISDVNPFLILPGSEQSSLSLIACTIQPITFLLPSLATHFHPKFPSPTSLLLSSSDISNVQISGDSLALTSPSSESTPISITLSSLRITNTSSSPHPIPTLPSLTQRLVSSVLHSTPFHFSGSTIRDFNFGGSLLVQNTSITHASSTANEDPHYRPPYDFDSQTISPRLVFLNGSTLVGIPDWNVTKSEVDTITITNCSFSHLTYFRPSTVSGGGSALFAWNILASCTLTRSSFSHCRIEGADPRGGSIYCGRTESHKNAGLPIRLSDCVFVNSSSSAAAGAAYFQFTWPVTIVGCVFDLCHADAQMGGALLAISEVRDFSVSNSKFVECLATYSGGVQLQTVTGSILFQSVLFDGCARTVKNADRIGAEDVMLHSVDLTSVNADSFSSCLSTAHQPNMRVRAMDDETIPDPNTWNHLFETCVVSLNLTTSAVDSVVCGLGGELPCATLSYTIATRMKGWVYDVEVSGNAGPEESGLIEMDEHIVNIAKTGGQTTKPMFVCSAPTFMSLSATTLSLHSLHLIQKGECLLFTLGDSSASDSSSLSIVSCDVEQEGSALNVITAFPSSTVSISASSFSHSSTSSASSADICAWLGSALSFADSTASVSDSALSHFPQGAIRIDGGSLSLNNVSFFNNTANILGFPSARRNVLCKGKGELTIVSWKSDNSSDTNRWISSTDCTVSENGTTLSNLLFVPTLNSSASSATRNKNLSFTVTLIGTSLFPCGLSLEIGEEDSPSNSKPATISLTQDTTTSMNETRIVLHVPSASLATFDETPKWRARLLFGDGEHSSSDFVFKLSLAEINAQKTKVLLSWLIPVVVIVSLGIIALIVVLLIILLRRCRPQKKNKPNSPTPANTAKNPINIDTDSPRNVGSESSQSSPDDDDIVEVGVFAQKYDPKSEILVNTSQQMSLFYLLHSLDRNRINKRLIRKQLPTLLKDRLKQSSTDPSLVTLSSLTLMLDGASNVYLPPSSDDTADFSDAWMEQVSRWHAPEYSPGSALTEKMLVFTVGLILYEVETCKMPFESLDPASARFEIKKQRIPNLDEVSDLSLKGLIKRCLSFVPDQRPSLDGIATFL
ncbi:hypothetical protein BLNAU_15440 [Blattamonas nauphoetae]|uniref:Serine-threonine/tyrosine-protein kinase catalytic domain-containing protein n=1 Tax=Blattamonas nauphoetae TaxID=2049346 RepID=A0ABQ9XDX9_9EUKA|nr:hypothetical protein BLNAU_15440 [Blattamonas nauphoetae]